MADKKSSTFRNKYIEPLNIDSILWARLNDLKHEIHCQKACKVITVDNDNNYVSVQILDKDSDGQGNIIEYPIIPNVPIRQSQESGSAYIRLPVQKGDIGTIEFFDSSVDDVIKQGLYSYSYDEEWHSLSDGLFTNGFLPDSKLFTFDSTNPITIGTKNGIFTLSVTSAGKLQIEGLNELSIKSDISIDLDAPNVSTTGNLTTGTGYSGIAQTGASHIYQGGICVNVINPS